MTLLTCNPQSFLILVSTTAASDISLHRNPENKHYTRLIGVMRATCNPHSLFSFVLASANVSRCAADITLHRNPENKHYTRLIGVMRATCNPHSLFSGFSHHHRPERMSSPGVTERVQGAQPMLG